MARGGGRSIYHCVRLRPRQSKACMGVGTSDNKSCGSSVRLTSTRRRLYTRSPSARRELRPPGIVKLAPASAPKHRGARARPLLQPSQPHSAMTDDIGLGTAMAFESWAGPQAGYSFADYRYGAAGPWPDTNPI